jgi:hypothetical protein
VWISVREPAVLNWKFSWLSTISEVKLLILPVNRPQSHFKSLQTWPHFTWRHMIYAVGIMSLNNIRINLFRLSVRSKINISYSIWSFKDTVSPDTLKLRRCCTSLSLSVSVICGTMLFGSCERSLIWSLVMIMNLLIFSTSDGECLMIQEMSSRLKHFNRASTMATITSHSLPRSALSYLL